MLRPTATGTPPGAPAHGPCGPLDATPTSKRPTSEVFPDRTLQAKSSKADPEFHKTLWTAQNHTHQLALMVRRRDPQPAP